MKKLLAILVAVALVLGMFTVASFADDTVVESSYEGSVSVGVWFGNTDNRKATRGVVFNAAADFVAFGIPQYWNSNGSNAPLVTYDFEIFNYATDYATSVAGTPVFKQTVTPEGDSATGIRFDFGKTLPKGEYAVRFTVTSAEGYMVLPQVTAAKYSNARIDFTDDVFGFYVEFVNAGLSKYFAKISTAGDEILETPVYPNGGGDGGPQNLKDGPIAIVVTIPEGYALRSAIGLQSPTWSNPGGGSDASAEVYKWTGDYDDSVDGDVLATAEIYDHPDNGNAVFNFDKEVGAGTYLIEFTAIGENSIGFWSFATADEGQLVFVNGSEASFYPKTALKLLVVDSEPETTEPETQAPAGPTVHGASFDSFFVNDVLNFGQGDGAASSKLDAVDRTVNGEDGSVQTITIRGWIGFEDQDIAQFGYKIGNNDPVFSDSFTEERGDIAAIRDPGNGGAHANAFKIVADMQNVYGTNKVVAVAKLADGTVVEIDESVPRNGEGTTPNTSFTFVGPADPNPPETQPTTVPETEPHTQTGDAAIAMFAVIAVLAMGAVVVFAKKRSF